MFNLSGFNIHLYGLLIGLGVYAGLMAAIKLFPKIENEIEKSFVWAVVFGVIGARLYHVVDYWQRYYKTNLDKIPAVWEGGLGIWGAVVGAIIGLIIYSRIYKKNLWNLLDAFAAVTPLAQAIGRLGNWANGELTGRNGEPLFAYESILNLILFVFILKRMKKQTGEGKILGIYLIGYGVIRIFLENLRPEEIIWKIGGIPVAIIFGLVAVYVGMKCLTKK